MLVKNKVCRSQVRVLKFTSRRYSRNEVLIMQVSVIWGCKLSRFVFVHDHINENRLNTGPLGTLLHFLNL